MPTDIPEEIMREARRLAFNCSSETIAKALMKRAERAEAELSRIKAGKVAIDPLDGGCPHCKWLDTNLGRVLEQKCELHQKIENMQVDHQIDRRVANDASRLMGEILRALGGSDDDDPLELARARMEEIAELEAALEPAQPDAVAEGEGYEPVAWQNLETLSSILTPEQYGTRLPMAEGRFRPLYAHPSPTPAGVTEVWRPAETPPEKDGQYLVWQATPPQSHSLQVGTYRRSRWLSSWPVLFWRPMIESPLASREASR